MFSRTLQNARRSIFFPNFISSHLPQSINPFSSVNPFHRHHDPYGLELEHHTDPMMQDPSALARSMLGQVFNDPYDPYYNPTNSPSSIKALLDYQRQLTDAKRAGLFEHRESTQQKYDPSGALKITHQTQERQAALGNDGRYYQRYEKISTDPKGSKHMVKCEIDGYSKVSTWSSPHGVSDSLTECDSRVPHLVTYSNPEGKEEFEKLWFGKDSPMMIGASETSKATLESGDSAGADVSAGVGAGAGTGASAGAGVIEGGKTKQKL